MIAPSAPALEEAPERVSSLDQMASEAEPEPEPQPVRRQRSNAQQQSFVREPGED